MSYTEPTGTTLDIELEKYDYIQTTGTVLDIELSIAEEPHRHEVIRGTWW